MKFQRRIFGIVSICLLVGVLLCSCNLLQPGEPLLTDEVGRPTQDFTDSTLQATDEPTEAPTEEATEAPAEETAEPEETEAKKTAATSKSSTSSSSKKNSSTSKKDTSTQKENKPKETEPPVIETEPPAEEAYDPTSYELGDLEYDLLDALNANRTEAEAGELDLSRWLSGIAYLRAKEASKSWSHTRPDGRDYESALADYGYGYDAVAELMVYTPGDGDAETIVGKWMDSKTHKKNICSDAFGTAGIGVYSKSGVTYVVCLLVG